MKGILGTGIFVFLLAQNLFANDKGNGGDGVVCYNEQHQITSVEMFDHFEARTRYQTPINLAFAGSTYLEKVNFLIDRVQGIEPQRGLQLREELNHFIGSSNFADGIELPDVPDQGSILLPDGCHIEQLAIQKEPTFPEEKFYTIDNKLWLKLSEDGKAGLVLHEIIYRLAIREGKQQDSVTSRYYNIRISSQAFVGDNLVKYFTLLASIKSDVRNTTFTFKGLTLFECSTSEGFAGCWKSNGGNWTLPNGDVIKLAADAPVNFTSENKLILGTLAAVYQTVIQGNPVKVIGYTGFFADGRIYRTHLAEVASYKLPSGFVIPAFGEIYLTQSYSGTHVYLRSIGLGADTVIDHLGTCEVMAPAHSVLMFEEYGALDKVAFIGSTGLFCMTTPAGIVQVATQGDIGVTGWRSGVPENMGSWGGTPRTIALPVGNTTIQAVVGSLNYSYPIKFYGNGALATATLAAPADLMNAGGILTHYPANSELFFNGQGQVLD